MGWAADGSGRRRLGGTPSGSAPGPGAEPPSGRGVLPRQPSRWSS